MANPTGIITAITAQARNRDRVNVFVDGEFALGLDREIAAGLRLGEGLNESRIAALQAQDSIAVARHKAVNYLAYRPRSVAEVRRHLARKGYEEQTIAAVVERLAAAGLLDDQAFARYWVEQRDNFKPRSSRALQQELRQKGVTRSVIDAVLAQHDDERAAQAAAEKQGRRWQDLPFDSFRLKMGQYLQRRGFNYSVSRDVIRQVWHELHNDD